VTLRTMVAVLLLAGSAAAQAVDVNDANRAQLEQVRHIGPPLADAILVARERDGAFKDWADLMKRVRGIRDGKAKMLSQAGLTVNGAVFTAAP
jgi:competence protein ComEA